MAELPTVGVVVVNYFGDERTMDCISSVLATGWPVERLRPVIVDNGSSDGFAAEVRRRFPGVEVIDAGSNVGFPAACNLGIRHLQDVDSVLLLNNDASLQAGCLESLTTALAGEGVGAAVPKIRLSAPMTEVELVTTPSRVGQDPRALGVQLSGAMVGPLEVTTRLELVDGFGNWETEPDGSRFVWSGAEARCYVPVDAPHDGAARLQLRLGCVVEAKDVDVRVGGAVTTATVDREPTWIDGGPVGPPARVLNCAGTELHPNGEAADRGFLRPDDGAFDEPGAAGGFSAAAVLLSRAFLEDVGPLDDRLFLYYEDVDLSWRGRLRGWDYRYVPAAVVDHDHSATTGLGSALALHLTRRNRLVVLVKNAPRPLLLGALRAFVAEGIGEVRRDVLGRLVRGRAPVTRHAVARVRVVLGVVRLVPWALARRWDRRHGRRRTRSGAIEGWLVVEATPGLSSRSRPRRSLGGAAPSRRR